MNKKMFNKLFREKTKIDHCKFHPDDNLIDVCLRKFKVQEEDMKNLRKNFDDFVYEIKNLTIIIENLYACFKNIYEPDWLGNAEFHQSCQQSMKLWRNFIDDFKNSIQMEYEKYADKFPEIKRVIDKSNKKSAEFQKCKQIFETYRNSKKQDINKIKKAQLEMNNAQDQFNEVNSVLKSDLPLFCDGRIQIYIQYLSLLFCAEDKLFQSLHEERQNQLQILTLLNESVNSGKYSIMNQVTQVSNHTNAYNIYDKKKAASVTTLFSTERRQSETTLAKGCSVWNISSPDSIYEQVIQERDDSTLNRTQSYHVGARTSMEDMDQNEGSKHSNSDEKKITLNKKSSLNDRSSPSHHQSFNVTTFRPSPPISAKDNSDLEINDDSYIYASLSKNHKSKSTMTFNSQSPQSDPSETHKKLTLKKVSIADDDSQKVPPDQFYYQVVAKYNYNGQDEDELDLKKEDVIMVLPWEHDDQQEIGWLYGENVKTKEKGLFPENHTCPMG